jgi:hypothetical protein
LFFQKIRLIQCSNKPKQDKLRFYEILNEITNRITIVVSLYVNSIRKYLQNNYII